ncbi:MAG TPA: electron transport complex subunit RsxB [Polaromonas sp.]
MTLSADCPPFDRALFERINAALPQTQCTRCGYPDCAAYAQAIAAGEAAINQCPPGGAEGVQRLSAITGLPALPLNPANGVEGPRAVAVIDEAWCIGCTLCLKACPTDAIMGSNKMMHTVIEPYCTGCELCIPVCPVDCISLENVSGTRTGWSAWSQAEADMARTRYAFHSLKRPQNKGDSPKKLEESEEETAPQALQQAPGLPARPETDAAVAERKRAVIEAALARARAQRLHKA